MWQRRLILNLRNLLIPSEAQPFIQLSMKRIIDWLYAPDGRFGTNPLEGRDDLLSRSLAEAVRELSTKLGPDMDQWRWGQNAYHHATILHPLASLVSPDVRAQLNVGPFPRGGDSYTINATGNGDNQTAGGSMKIIADTENWDNSLAINNPGQSGNPDSMHYRDLFDLWSRGKYFPLLYSRAKVESVVGRRVILQNAAAPTASAR
jgi:penicillin amidase